MQKILHNGNSTLQNDPSIVPPLATVQYRSTEEYMVTHIYIQCVSATLNNFTHQKY